MDPLSPLKVEWMLPASDQSLLGMGYLSSRFTSDKAYAEGYQMQKCQTKGLSGRSLLRGESIKFNVPLSIF